MRTAARGGCWCCAMQRDGATGHSAAERLTHANPSWVYHSCYAMKTAACCRCWALQPHRQATAEGWTWRRSWLGRGRRRTGGGRFRISPRVLRGVGALKGRGIVRRARDQGCERGQCTGQRDVRLDFEVTRAAADAGGDGRRRLYFLRYALREEG